MTQAESKVFQALGFSLLPASCLNSWDPMVKGSEDSRDAAAEGVAGVAISATGKRTSGPGGWSLENHFLYINISTMSAKSCTRDGATESREAVRWLLLQPRRLSGSVPRPVVALSRDASVWVLPSLLPCLA